MLNNQNDSHLVVLGVKVNSWAWGLEQINRLSKLGEKVIVLDLGTNPGRTSDNPRTKFQLNLLSELGCQYLDWRSVLPKSTRRKISSDVRAWLKQIQHLDQWHLQMFEDMPLGRILMSNHARTAGTKEFPLSLLSLGSQIKITSQAVLSLRVFEALNVEFSKVSVSNGRSPVEAGVLFGARRDGKETFVLERGASTQKWFIWETSCHYSPDWWKLLEKTSVMRESDSFLITANDYWARRLKGWDSLSGRDWGREFDKGNLPKSLPREFVTFFCTSEHESPALPEFECSNLGFTSQQLAVKKLAEICDSLNIPLVIKRHPNSLAADGVDREESHWAWTSQYPEIVYIGPRDRVDSYELILKSTAVVTFRSSVGIEAAALGIPSRAMGPAEWACSEESRVWSETDLRDFIGNPTLLSNSPHLEWGYLASTFGQQLDIFTDITGGYALVGETKFFSSERYKGSMEILFERLKGRIWASRIKLLARINR
jgi:hypothetical protein